MPDGRQEVDLEKVVVLFTDPEEVKQGRSHLVIVIMVVVMMVMMVMMVIMVIMVVMVVVIFIMIAISIMIVNSITATF